MILSSGKDYNNPGVVERMSMALNDRNLQAWTKPELITHVNDEQQQLGARVNRLHRDYFMESSTTPTTGEARYQLPTNLVKLWGVELADTTTDDEPQDLVEVMLDSRNFYTRLQEINEKRQAGYFYVRARDFVLSPPVATGKTLRVFYVRELVDFKTDGTDDAKESDIPRQHHQLLVWGGCIRAQAKNKRQNKVITDLYKAGLENMVEELAYFSATKTEQREPFYGTFGPGRYYPYVSSRTG